MKKGQCLMWTKRKYSVSSNYLSSYDDDSWEEKAFAKDAASGSDCIWPPRSYSCSFCRREFKSAQALGGHMNVHRRDRARLKQPSSPQNEILFHDLETTHPHNQAQNSLASFGYLYQTGLDYSTNPNSDNPSHVLPSPSMVLPREKTMIPLYNSSVLQETSPADSSKSWSNLAEDCRLYSSKFDPEAGVEKNLKGLDSECRSDEENSDKTDMAVSLNLFVCKADPPVQFETKETDLSFKKRKTDASSNPFFSKSSLVDRHHMQSQQMFEFSPNSLEELDLELRLGYRPKV